MFENWPSNSINGGILPLTRVKTPVCKPALLRPFFRQTLLGVLMLSVPVHGKAAGPRTPPRSNNLKTYRIKKGDTLSELAKRLLHSKERYKEFLKWNPKIKDPDAILADTGLFFKPPPKLPPPNVIPATLSTPALEIVTADALKAPDKKTQKFAKAVAAEIAAAENNIVPAQKIAQESVSALIKKAQTAADKQQFAQAQIDIEQALAADPASVPAKIVLIRISTAQGDKQKAKDVAAQLAREQPQLANLPLVQSALSGH